MRINRAPSTLKILKSIPPTAKGVSTATLDRLYGDLEVCVGKSQLTDFAKKTAEQKEALFKKISSEIVLERVQMAPNLKHIKFAQKKEEASGLWDWLVKIFPFFGQPQNSEKTKATRDCIRDVRKELRMYDSHQEDASIAQKLEIVRGTLTALHAVRARFDDKAKNCAFDRTRSSLQFEEDKKHAAIVGTKQDRCVKHGDVKKLHRTNFQILAKKQSQRQPISQDEITEAFESLFNPIKKSERQYFLFVRFNAALAKISDAVEEKKDPKKTLDSYFKDFVDCFYAMLDEQKTLFSDAKETALEMKKQQRHANYIRSEAEAIGAWISAHDKFIRKAISTQKSPSSQTIQQVITTYFKQLAT